MDGRIPAKSPGDPLFAAEVNVLSGAADMALVQQPGGTLHGVRSRLVSGAVGMPAFAQRLLYVREKLLNSDNSWTTGYYKVWPRWYDHSTGEWASDEGSDWELDASDLGLTLAEGDKIVGYWDDQRRMFVPLYSKAESWIVRNDSGVNLKAGDILGIDGVLNPPDTEESYYDPAASFRACRTLLGIEPDFDSHRLKWVVLLEDVLSGETGKCCVDGYCVAQVVIEDAYHHDWCGVIRVYEEESSGSSSVSSSSSSSSSSFSSSSVEWGSFKLLSKGGGIAQIIWREREDAALEEDKLGLQWCLIRLGTPGTSEYWGVVESTMGTIVDSPRGSSSFSVYSIYTGQGDTDEDTGHDLTVWSPPVQRAGSVSAGKWGRAKWDIQADRFLLHPVEC